MTFNITTIGKIIRIIVGIVIIIMGIIYSNWIGILGIFLLMSAIGGCGLGSTSCSAKSVV